MGNDTIIESKEIDTLKQIARQEHNFLSLSFIRTNALANRRQLESKRFNLFPERIKNEINICTQI